MQMQTYYVIFSNSPRWFSKFMRKGCAHVSIVRKLDDETGIELNAGNHLIVDIYTTTVSSQNNKHILKINVDYSDSKLLNWQFIFWRWGIFNCVSITKYVLGIKSWSITPHQLYKLLHDGKYARKNRHITSVEVIL